MGGKGRRRREKNYLAAHGDNTRLPPPPNPSYVDVLPSKLRKIMSFTSSFSSSSSPTPTLQGNPQKKSKKDNTSENNAHSAAEFESKSSEIGHKRDHRATVTQVTHGSKEDVSDDAHEDKKRKKRKRKQVNDLRFEAELEKMGVISKRRQRKKEFLKAKKLKQKKGNTEQTVDLPKRDEVKFGDVVEAPPKLNVIPKAPKKPVDASRERLRLEAIEAYRNRKGWTNRLGLHLPPISTSPDL